MDVRASRRTWLSGCVTSVLCLLASVSIAFGQSGHTANLSNTVADNAGVVPGATVEITNSANGNVRSVVTDSTGVFRFVSVPPGPYKVKVSMEGFKQIDTELTVLSGENRDLGKLTLTIGGRTETVNATAEVTPVQTTSSALQKNLSGDLLTSLHVKGRDVFGMLKILPGVVDAQASPFNASVTIRFDY